MKNTDWYRISVRLDESIQDLLIGQLTPLGFNGFSQEKNMVNCYIRGVDWSSAIKNELQAILKRIGNEYPSMKHPFSISLIHNKNWNKAWEKEAGIVEATSRIIIKPSWKKLPIRHKNKIVLHIDPKMSFGTGHHETTRLSLGLLERFVRPNMRVLDFGCGTGILGIASIKLGARSVLAVDIDEWSVRNTHENIRRNKMDRKLKVIEGSIETVPKIKYDLIIANIDHPTIVKYIKHISSRVIKQGIIIFSGILETDMELLLPIFQRYSLVPIEIDNENEWTAIALYRA